MSMPSSDPTLIGVLNLIQPSKNKTAAEYLPAIGEVEDDMEGEQETIPDSGLSSETNAVHLDLGDGAINLPDLLKTVSEMSKGVSEGTHAEYMRLMGNCEGFLVANKLVKEGEFFSMNPHPNAPVYIVAWIMDSCDEFNISGTRKPSNQLRSTYGYAQKMRASMTYVFGRLLKIGSLAFHYNEVSKCWVGNPSVSEAVSTYMLSLRRRKVQAGEAPTSARAVTPSIMGSLYDFNHRPENWDIKRWDGPRTKAQKEQDIAEGRWTGPYGRHALQLAYTLAFTCLLRVDEVMKIKAPDIKLLNDETIELTLPFRKTSQFGEIQPFVLREFPPAMAHLCPVRAYSDWIKATKINEGYVFRKLGSGDRPSSDLNVQMTSEHFLEMFRNNLIDICVDPAPYGTHSFRRGGCQWMSVDLRWHLREICEWGGWSTEFTHLTIVKYLISWNDSPSQRREDFFNFKRAPVLKCWSCGRSCWCA